jgi:hypothetical protein
MLVIELIRCIDIVLEFKISVFDAIQKIEDAWNRVSEQTIRNCFHHSIVSKTIQREDENKVSFIDKLIETKSASLLTFFESKIELNDYLAVDEKIETIEIDEEDKTEIGSKNDLITPI